MGSILKSVELKKQGKSTLEIRKLIPIEEAHKAMISAGVSTSFAEAVMETARSFNKGNSMALEKRSPENTTKTTLEQWAMEQFGRK
jgi:hypothetical protein